MKHALFWDSTTQQHNKFHTLFLGFSNTAATANFQLIQLLGIISDAKRGCEWSKCATKEHDDHVLAEVGSGALQRMTKTL